MLATAMIFLVMLVPDTAKPTLVLMLALPTVKECQVILDRAPVDQRDRFACIQIDLKPSVEGTTI